MTESSSVRLEPMGTEGRALAYEWLYCSDKPAFTFGYFEKSDVPVPTLEEFALDYPDFFFDGSDPKQGRCFYIIADETKVGKISYSGFHLEDGFVEFDIWLDEEARCGRGIGSKAITLLVEWVRANLSAKVILIRPSRLNERAVRSYSKVGFKPFIGDISAFYIDPTYLVGDCGEGGDVFMILNI